MKLERSEKWWLDRARAEGDATPAAGMTKPKPLEELFKDWDAAEYEPTSARVGDEMARRLRAVAKRHEGRRGWNPKDERLWCDACSAGDHEEFYPCPTMRVLNGEIE